MNLKSIRKKISVVLLFVAIIINSFVVRAEDSKSINLTNTVNEQYRIEQVRAVMPYVRAYFYPDETYDTNSGVYGMLGDERLEMMDSRKWAETGYGIDYYFLIDNSKSVNKEDFDKVKGEIAAVSDYMNANDTVSIYVVGDTAEKKAGKLSMADSEQLVSVLDSIQRDGMNTNLYNAIKDAATEIAGENTDTSFTSSDNIDEDLGFGKNRSVIVAVTDGVNDTENGYGKDETISKLVDNNIPLYLIQERMSGENGSESRADIQQVVRQSGGDYILVQDYEAGSSVQGLYSLLNSCYVATFKSTSNKTSGETVGFNIVYQTEEGDKSFNEKTIKPDKHVSDTNAPEVTNVSVVDEHTIKIEFSKDVSDTAKNLSLYEIKVKNIDKENDKKKDKDSKEEKSIKPTGADFDVDSQSVIMLTTSDTLWNGDYTVKISGGITDTTEEANPMAEVSMDVSYKDGKDYVPEKKSFFHEYWWVVLAGFIVIVIVILLIIFAVIKKRKGLVVVDDKVVLADRVDEQIHLHINKVQVGTAVNQGFPISLIIKSGGKMIKEINAKVDGSLIVGRAEICDLYIDDPHMSKQHFAIEFSNNMLMIMDLESKNGTFLNGVRLNGKRRLSQNDVIQAGSLEIIIRW